MRPVRSFTVLTSTAVGSARIVVSELNRCSRSDPDRALMAWVMTAWMAGS
jgi:hypothetical protein